MVRVSEPLLTLGEVSDNILPPVHGKPISPVTIWRWATRGLNGCQLETVKIGRRVLTTESAVLDFLKQSAETGPTPRAPRKPTEAPRKRTAKQRERDMAAARKSLQDAGMLK